MLGIGPFEVLTLIMFAPVVILGVVGAIGALMQKLQRIEQGGMARLAAIEAEYERETKKNFK